ncbi:MAG: HigA family addiction module antitoxin [Rhizobiaceae bacterium]
MTVRHKTILPSHPGELLREIILPELRISKTAVAQSLGISRQTLYDIINEKQPVTAEMAVRFGKYFGNGGAFWNTMQGIYDLAIAENTIDVSKIPSVNSQRSAAH